MEATAVSVGKAVLDGALGYAKSKVAKEIVLQLGVERDFVFITDELQMMQSFLMTADEEQNQNKVLMTWVKQIGDLAYNVEDSLMDFSLHSEKKTFWGRIPRSPCDRRRIAKDVKELRAKVEDVSCRNLRYHLINENSGSKPAVAEEQANIASAAMFGINEARVAALEKEKSEVDLHQLIASNNVDLKVIAVWGTAGDLGKTTAIQEVYDNPKVVSNFGFRAWVRLAHPFNPKEFLHSIVRQFYENSPGKLGDSLKWKTVGSNILMNMEEMTQSNITNEFDTQVNCSRYLIVIDNLSTISEWNCVKRFFPDNKKRSRIIISTQQAELASLCTEQPYQVSELKQLSSDQTLYVFHKKNNSEEQVIMAEAGVAMLDINEPKLATAHKEKLKVSLRQLISDEVKDLRVIVVKETCGDLGNLSIIKEVYDDPTVNANFGLCAWVTLTRPFNPKEFIQSLIRQFTKSSPDEFEDAEEITSFRDNNVLIKMEKRKPRDFDCLFDAQVRDNSYLFVINDLSTVEEWDCVKKYFLDYKKRSRIIVSTHQVEVGSLCTEQTYQVLEMKQLSSDQILCTFHNKVTHESSSAESISDIDKVTTTEKNIAIPTSEIQEDQQPESASEDKVYNSTAKKKFYRNRTLALADEMFTGRNTEKSFVIKLVFQPEQNEGCKVISVWGMGGLGKTTLVRSVYRSQELSSLKRAWATAMRPFNPEVLLRDITLQLQKSIQEDPAGATATGAQTKSIGAMQLFELKEELSRLLNTQKCLIVLDDISSTFEWDLVNRSLGSAGIIIVTTREKNIAEHCSREYKNMYSLEGLKEDAALELFKKKLYKLGVAGISNENSKQFWSAIASHNQLRSLSVQGYPWRELDGCLGEDLSPPNFLRSFKLYGELVRLTEWIHQLQNLSKLILAYTHLEQDGAIQALGVLPNLAILRLMWGSFVGNQLHFQGPSFPSLMVLELNGLTDVKSVFFEEHSMPRLELLQADWCWSLKEISGLPVLTSLKGVRLGYQISQELKEQVQSQVTEHKTLVSLDTNYVSSFSMQ